MHYNDLLDLLRDLGDLHPDHRLDRLTTAAIETGGIITTPDQCPPDEPRMCYIDVMGIAACAPTTAHAIKCWMAHAKTHICALCESCAETADPIIELATNLRAALTEFVPTLSDRPKLNQYSAALAYLDLFMPDAATLRVLLSAPLNQKNEPRFFAQMRACAETIIANTRAAA